MATDTEPKDRTQEVILPANHTFVVQVRQGTPLSGRHIQGRIEHLRSGQAIPFTSWAEAHTFVVRVLSEIRNQP